MNNARHLACVSIKASPPSLGARYSVDNGILKAAACHINHVAVRLICPAESAEIARICVQYHSPMTKYVRVNKSVDAMTGP